MILIVFYSLFLFSSPTLIANTALQNERQPLKPLLTIESSLQGFIPVPFWESMAWKRGVTGQELFDDTDLKIAEENFKNFCGQVADFPQSYYSKPPQNYTIPPIIHFIWLGSPIPLKVNLVIESWKRCHPGWEIRVWTDTDVDSFFWSSQRLQTGFIQAETWAEKSDILRFEILYQFGGIYSDTDVICFKSFHDLVTNDLTFFGGLEFNYIIKDWNDPLYVGTAIMGAIKGSPIMKYSLDHYRTAQEAPTVNLVHRSGPGLVSRACHEAIASSDKDSILILPCSYFYPLPYNNKWIPSEEVLEFISPESLAVHLWDGSWLK